MLGFSVGWDEPRPVRAAAELKRPLTEGSLLFNQHVEYRVCSDDLYVGKTVKLKFSVCEDLEDPGTHLDLQPCSGSPAASSAGGQ